MPRLSDRYTIKTARPRFAIPTAVLLQNEITENEHALKDIDSVHPKSSEKTWVSLNVPK